MRSDLLDDLRELLGRGVGYHFGQRQLQLLGEACRELEYYAQPIPMILFCPRCGGQHVDAPDPEKGWENPPHRSHLCRFCNCVFRPADVPTTGVAQIATRGQADTFSVGEPGPVRDVRSQFQTAAETASRWTGERRWKEAAEAWKRAAGFAPDLESRSFAEDQATACEKRDPLAGYDPHGRADQHGDARREEVIRRHRSGETDGRTIYRRFKLGNWFEYRSDLIAFDYMRRWILRVPPGMLRLHHILRGDHDRHFHDHPMDFASLILAGGYIEHRPGGISWRYEPGDIVRRKAEDLHRIELIGESAWTLVVTGPIRRDWGFMTEEGWVVAGEYDAWCAARGLRMAKGS